MNNELTLKLYNEISEVIDNAELVEKNELVFIFKWINKKYIYRRELIERYIKAYKDIEEFKEIKNKEIIKINNDIESYIDNKIKKYSWYVS